MEKHAYKVHKNLAWVISVNMGYGHERAAHPLTQIAQNQEIIIANTFAGISAKDQSIWRRSRIFYEFISRFKKMPLIGEKAFSLFDKLQSIPQFYPKRNLSQANMEINTIYRLIKKGWLKDLIMNRLNKKKLPIVSTFFVPAFVADYWGYKEDIFCIVTDTDMSRTWVAQNPKKSKIKYFAPTQRVEERLQLYGVPKKNIFLTGFPLPKKNIGGKQMHSLKKDLGARLYNLDPQKRFLSKYRETVKYHLGQNALPSKATHPLTLTFGVGGAGAQRQLGMLIIKSLKKQLTKNELKIILVAGSRNDVYLDFKKAIYSCGLKKQFDKNIKILYSPDKFKYFDLFAETLRKTDILWTKPSELSFFSGLGIPIIMAPSIGSQEFFNRQWLKSVGAGITQNNPQYTNEWLFDWINSGWLAKAALEGYLYAPKMGTYNIEEILLHRKLKQEKPALVY